MEEYVCLEELIEEDGDEEKDDGGVMKGLKD